MKLALKLATAVALVAFAAPALPCEGMKTAKKEQAKPVVAATAKAEKKAAPKAKAAEAKPAPAPTAN